MNLQQLAQVYKHNSINVKQHRAERKAQLGQMVVGQHKANVDQEARHASKHESRHTTESKVDHSPTLEHWLYCRLDIILSLVQSEEAQMGTMVVPTKPKRRRRTKEEVEAEKDREAIERVKAKELGPASTSTLGLNITHTLQVKRPRGRASAPSPKVTHTPKATHTHAHTHTIV
jgi:hypothetical protein